MYVCIHVRKRKDSYIIGDDINMKNQYGKQFRFILHLFKHIYLKKTLKKAPHVWDVYRLSAYQDL